MLRRTAPLQNLKKAPCSIRDPEKWSEVDFLNTSLNHLSRTLSHSLSHKRTLAVYFNWIEAHRRQVTELTEDWGETIIYWILALRSRGFGREQLIDAINEYRTKNGIYSERINVSRYQIRCFPMVYDLKKAWAAAYPGAENQEYYWSGSGKYVKQQETQPFKKVNQPFNKERQYPKQEDFEGTPPGNYVCNRCRRPGHFLEVCPTNLDPSFDKPPGMDYKCPVCLQWGVHYKSLCPSNQDPYSINQKRVRAGIGRDTYGGSSGKNSGSDILRSWQQKIDDNENGDLLRGRAILDRSGGSDDSSYHTSPEEEYAEASSKSDLYENERFKNQQLKNDLYEHERLKRDAPQMKQIHAVEDMKLAIESGESVQSSDGVVMRNRAHRSVEKRPRPVSPDASMIEERKVTNDKSPSPTREDTLRNKLALIDEYEHEAVHGKELDWKARALIAKKATYKARLKRMEEEVGIMDQPYNSELLKYLGDPFRKTPAVKRVKLAPSMWTPPESSFRIGLTMGMDIESEGGKTPKIISHVDFMKKLIGKFPELTKKINQVRKVQSATVMWDRSAEDFYRLAQPQPNQSPGDTDMDDEHVEGGYAAETLDRLSLI